MEPVGSERRRTDLYGRARRFAYGILLLAAAPGALAADELAYLGKYRAQAHPPAATATATERALLATLQGLVMIHAERVNDAGAPLRAQLDSPRIALDTITARVQDLGEAPLFRVAVSERPSIRDGIGFDIAVPDLGHFHLNLYARRNARSEGKRWALNAGSQEAAERNWSLGGTLELVRTVGGGRHLAFVPELLFDLSELENSYLPFQASFKFANWRSIGEREALDERAPQLMFKWRL